jgi:hypothetical protein
MEQQYPELFLGGTSRLQIAEGCLGFPLRMDTSLSVSMALLRAPVGIMQFVGEIDRCREVWKSEKGGNHSSNS